MKRSIFTLALIAIGSMGVMTSCSGDDSEKSAESAEEAVAKKEYYCPMKCEGDKMHAEPGSCSVCGMDLVRD